MDIWLTNSMTGKREKLETKIKGKLTFYSCGPTVYGPIHIGNLRAALVADMFFRMFKRFGYDVTFVRNYTDVDDKIIQRAVKENTTADAIAKTFTQEVERDYALAGLEEPSHKTKVTEHIPEIIAMIEKIIANGHAYLAADGEVFYSIESFLNYGKLSRKKIEDLVAGHRVDVRDNKRNPLDFSLWKPAKPGEPYWESPWCNGRPGWHIECSAMACKWLGDQIDVHHGGEDLIFPHHENEIAQSEGASGHAPYVGIWLHNAFLNFGKQKMSKSLGNVISARDYLSRFGGEVTRMMTCSAHYRAIIDFGDDTLENALVSLERIYEAKAHAVQLLQLKSALPDLRAEGAWSEFLASAQVAHQAIDQAYANDLNTAAALGSLFTLIRDFNRTLTLPRTQATPAAVLGATELIRVLEDDIYSVIGIGRTDPARALAQINEIRMNNQSQTSGKPQLTEAEITAAIEARISARKSKNFAESDRIRDDLLARGVVLKDGPQGTSWSYKG